MIQFNFLRVFFIVSSFILVFSTSYSIEPPSSEEGNGNGDPEIKYRLSDDDLARLREIFKVSNNRISEETNEIFRTHPKLIVSPWKNLSEYPIDLKPRVGTMIEQIEVPRSQRYGMGLEMDELIAKVILGSSSANDLPNAKELEAFARRLNTAYRQKINELMSNTDSVARFNFVLARVIELMNLEIEQLKKITTELELLDPESGDPRVLDKFNQLKSQQVSIQRQVMLSYLKISSAERWTDFEVLGEKNQDIAELFGNTIENSEEGTHTQAQESGNVNEHSAPGPTAIGGAINNQK